MGPGPELPELVTSTPGHFKPNGAPMDPWTPSTPAAVLSVPGILSGLAPVPYLLSGKLPRLVLPPRRRHWTRIPSHQYFNHHHQDSRYRIYMVRSRLILFCYVK